MQKGEGKEKIKGEREVREEKEKVTQRRGKTQRKAGRVIRARRLWEGGLSGGSGVCGRQGWGAPESSGAASRPARKGTGREEGGKGGGALQELLLLAGAELLSPASTSCPDCPDQGPVLSSVLCRK